MGRRSFLSGFLHGHVGIRENSAADSAAKGALDVDVSDELIPFSDFRPLVSKYVRALAIRVGRVSPQQPVYIGSFQSRMIVFLFLMERRLLFLHYISVAQIWFASSSFFSSFFLKLKGDLPVYIPCDELFIIRYILRFCSDFVEARERYFTARPRKMVFEDILSSFGCDYLREISIFGKFCIFGSFYAVFSFFKKKNLKKLMMH